MMNVLIRDESMNREMLQELSVVLPDDKITVRDLIRTRIRREFTASDAYESSQPESGNDVAVGNPSIHGAPVPTIPVEWESELKKALDAFITNRLVILIDNRQVKSLDESIEINSETKISFLRLTFVMGS